MITPLFRTLSAAAALAAAALAPSSAAAQEVPSASEREPPGCEFVRQTGPNSFVMRCRQSVQAGPPPLYVVDGRVVERKSIDRFLPDGLAEEEVKSVTLVKGEEALARYGEAGRHGVIVIETKRGAAGRSNPHLSGDVADEERRG